MRDARAGTVVPALRSPETLRLLAANLEAAFDITIPASDLDHLSTVRDVLQCVRLRRWVARVEREIAAQPQPGATTPPQPAEKAAAATSRTFRITRRNAPPPAAPGAATPPSARTSTRRR